ncbi:MAG: haloacid dehalogenase-like hydrolase [Bdellovibrionaceae bacterium]|mgnify:FL=1|jgi:phosphoserine phosphatase|nr:haloacid dehalogenase-like hydrolase [Pseudobdellovibrionaceae bacterium]
MPFKNSEDTVSKILKQIDTALDQGANKFAAFDADGTLWSADAGDIFYEYIIKNKLVSLPESPWESFLKMKKESPVIAYLWLAQIFNGLPLTQVQDWAQKAFEEASPYPTFSQQKQIIDHLHKNNVQVFIVTASIKWAVEPCANLYNIPKANVIGVETLVTDGIVTNEQYGPVTFREGKVDGLQFKTQQKPFFVSGNTFGDLELLKHSSHIRLAMHSATRDERVFPSEIELLEYAKKEGWFYLSK